MEMKITREEFERSTKAGPLELFMQGIRSEETKKTYTRTLRRILCNVLEEILEGTFEERTEQLVRAGREDPGWVLDVMLNISKKLRERTELPHDHRDYCNPSSVSNQFKPIKKMLDMSDITIPWKRVYSTFPESDNTLESRGWERGEIQSMLRFASGPMDRALVLVAASSGIRLGGFDLQWSDLKPIYRNAGKLSLEGDGVPVCGMLTIYGRTGASYPAFVTPEAYAAVMDYRNTWIAEVGRDPKPGDPIFKRAGMYPIGATRQIVKKRVGKMVKNAGLRTQDRKAQGRYDVPIMNGFRRFWNKACKESDSRESPLSSLIKKEYMMGHMGLVSLDRNYFKVHMLELAEEYLQAVPSLTIDDTARLQMENARQAQRISRLEDEKSADIASLRIMVEQLAKRIESRI